MGTLWNTYAFYVLYANIDNFNPMEHTLDYEKLSVMDKWILSKLNSTIQTCDSSLENYKIPETAKALQEFVDDLSNWYVRRSRERYWAKGMEQDKVNAYMTLYTLSLIHICFKRKMWFFQVIHIFRSQNRRTEDCSLIQAQFQSRKMEAKMVI